MRKGSGITHSTIVAVVMGLLVGTAITVQELRSRDLAVRPQTAAAMLSAPRELASKVDPAAFIPGFDPDRDVERVLRVLEKAEARELTASSARRAAAPTPERPSQASKALAKQPKAKGTAPVMEQSDPRLSLRDLEALKQELMAYAETRQGVSETPKVAEANEIRPAAPPEMRTVATFLVMKQSGPRVLVCVRDRFGTQVFDLELSGEMATRLSQNASPEGSKPALLLLQRFLSP